tara:strand:+ start:1380 stop:1550 length:171 start_codon:yes stop_codon:yes gene_type:complete
VEAKDIILIRQALTHSVTTLEIRVEDLEKSGIDSTYARHKLEQAEQALKAVYRGLK